MIHSSEAYQGNEMDRIDYFEEALSEAFCEADAYDLYKQLSVEQKRTIASCMEGASENVGQAFYQPENPVYAELEAAKKSLYIERNKVGCNSCKGTGRIQYMAGPWHTDSQCDKCGGEGKIQR